MAVPKKRSSRSAQGQRRGHHALKATQLLMSEVGLAVPRRLLKAANLGLLKKTSK